MKLLLHVCCAPCSIGCIASLREENIDPVLFWYNPNIHPYTEYKNRRDTMVQYAQSFDLSLIMEDEYGLRLFLENTDRCAEDFSSRYEFPQRCLSCYRLRMERTAFTAAKEKNFDAFSTTLFISPYQNHELLRQQAEAAAEQHGAAFLYRDFRPHFRKAQGEARQQGLYMQKYCGCIFSEEERQ